MTVSLHHTEHGPADGAPVLALHGWMPDHRLMTGCLEPVFDARKRAYRRLYPDLPGMGASPADGVDSSDDVLTCVEAYVDERIGDAPFLLLGESYGGYLARALAARRPDQVLALGLICPVGAILAKEDRNVPEHRALIVDPALDVPADSSFRDNFVVQTPDTYARSQAEIVPGLEAADTAALDRIRRRWALSDDPEAGGPYDGPTLFVLGRQDADVGYVDQWALLEHYPRATFAVLDTAGHSAQIERGALFEALVNDWLDRVENVRP